MSYFLHRISHEWSISKPLFDKGYLTVGWGYLLGNEKAVSNVMNHGDTKELNKLMYEVFETDYRKNRSLIVFSQLRPGDVVVVPLYWGYFSIVRVKSGPKPVTELPASVLEGLPAVLKKGSEEKGIYRNDELVDLGFYVETEGIRYDIPRSWAGAKLQSRMKIRQTNTWTDDLQSEIDEAAKSKAPVDFHDVIAEETAKIILSAITAHKNPADVEKLVRWYMKKAGATNVYKPSKPAGESGEYNYADADVAAEFAPLGVNIYIQVKKHDGETGSWAVEQITKYKNLQEKNFADGETNILWVLSTAGNFSDEAISLAQENSVRLIDGIEFARMVADAGISDINDFTSI